MSLLSDLVSSIVDAPGTFADIAAHDPLSAILLGIGGLLIGASVAVFGILVVGAVVELFTPSSAGKSFPPVR